MSFNIRYDNPKDGKNKWDDRKTELAELINFYDPGILGIQEALFHQLSYLDNNLQDHGYIGVGRKDGKRGGEFSAVFYDTTKYSLIRDGTFWLSETGEAGKSGWDAALERICTYGLFETKQKKQTFWVFNTHFDHLGEKAREMSARLILKKIKTFNRDGLPVILTGDLNSLPQSEPIKILQKFFGNGLKQSDLKIYGPVGTFNGFNNCTAIERRIDYIFAKGFKIISYRHIDDKLKNNYCVSDHLPVFVVLNF
jgi:endonuclease/exonuclease/phosphatase family metal-dependent hydrolase